jgi:NTE family protein
MFGKTLLVFALGLITLKGTAQRYTNLVFEGGGIRGIAYTGALQVLNDNKILPDIRRVAGTSAGAIAALTVALGYAPEEVEKVIYDTKIQKFNDGKFFFIGGISRINQKYGWYRGEAFTKWLEEIIKAKTGHADITFQQFHDRGFRDLYVTGTSLNHQKLMVFSYENYPDMKIKDAVRISMSIPLYFEAVCIDTTGHVLDIRKATGYYDIMVDGGFTGNFPIFIFDSVTHFNGVPQRMPNAATIGLRLDTEEQINFDQDQKGLAPMNVEKFKDYMSAFYNYIIENLNRSTLTAEDWKRTVSISTGGIGPKIRKLSPREKEILISNGQTGMKNFLSR